MFAFLLSPAQIHPWPSSYAFQPWLRSFQMNKENEKNEDGAKWGQGVGSKEKDGSLFCRFGATIVKRKRGKRKRQWVWEGECLKSTKRGCGVSPNEGGSWRGKNPLHTGLQHLDLGWWAWEMRTNCVYMYMPVVFCLLYTYTRVYGASKMPQW